MAHPRAAKGKRGPGLRAGVAASALLHLGFAALAVLASSRREKPPEPLPPPAAFAVEFESGAPERPAETESNPPPSEPEAAPPPEPPVAAVEPPAPETALAPPAEVPPPPEPPPPEQVAEAPQPPEPPPPEQVAEVPVPPPAPPPLERTAEAEPPRPPEVLPVPPPPAPPPPQREAALVSPPRPVRPPPSEPLPGLLLPEARTLQPAPQRPPGPRPGMDLSPGRWAQPGRDSPEGQLSVRGAQVGPDWRNAFRRWVEEHVRYPHAAAVLNEKGTSTIELVVAPDGRVQSWRLLRRSGSVWLDYGTVTPFRNANLPPFPPGADPNGVVINFTIYWVGQR